MDVTVRVSPLLVSLCCVATTPQLAQAYVPDDPFSSTASGAIAAEGDPAIITWSLLRDGTSITGEGGSDLIAFLDDIFNVSTTSADFEQRPWFTYLEQSFDRWTEVGGIEFVYEPNDDGAGVNSASGVLGVRGDMRLGGAFVDGAGGTLAYAWLPQIGDIVIDTGETSFYANSSNNYRALRNVLMHEVGHAFGLLHVESNTHNLLMEPFATNSFDGPQLDDIRGIHGLYGDPNERSNNLQGNNSAGLATSLGALAEGADLAVGTSANISGQSVSSSATDFVSITNGGDQDYYSFEVAAAGELTASLTPLGGVFNQGVEGSGGATTFDANARNDLALEVYDADRATLLASIDAGGMGDDESLAGLELEAAGTYFVRVLGGNDSVQFYELGLSFELAEVVFVPGDYNADGVVDAADYAVWQGAFGDSVADFSGADGNGDGVVDAADYTVWRDNLGATAADFANAIAAPEPVSSWLLVAGAVFLVGRRKRL